MLFLNKCEVCTNLFEKLQDSHLYSKSALKLNKRLTARKTHIISKIYSHRVSRFSFGAICGQNSQKEMKSLLTTNNRPTLFIKMQFENDSFSRF